MIKIGKYELKKTDTCYIITKDISETKKDIVAYYSEFNKALFRFSELSGGKKQLEAYIDNIEKIMKKYGVVEK